MSGTEKNDLFLSFAISGDAVLISITIGGEDCGWRKPYGAGESNFFPLPQPGVTTKTIKQGVAV